MLRNRIFLAALAAILLALPAVASDAPPTAPGVQRFGTPITVKKTVQLKKLNQAPERFTGKVLSIEGVVKNVCQGQGCWVEVEDAKGASFIARSLDESVLLPKDCKGQRVKVQGTFMALPAKEHDHAEHAGAAAHECPSPTYVLSTQGVELVAAKK